MKFDEFQNRRRSCDYPKSRVSKVGTRPSRGTKRAKIENEVTHRILISLIRQSLSQCSKANLTSVLESTSHPRDALFRNTSKRITRHSACRGQCLGMKRMLKRPSFGRPSFGIFSSRSVFYLRNHIDAFVIAGEREREREKRQRAVAARKVQRKCRWTTRKRR